MEKEPIIEFKDFSFRYKSQTEPTLKNINLTIKTPERVNFTNGSKTFIQFKLDKIHLFDKDNQESLRRTK